MSDKILANETYICPFCAYSGKLVEYRIKAESYTGKTFQCPDCKQIMRRNTLLREITPREWGMWLYASIRVYNGIHDKFYDRIKKEKDGKKFVLASRLYQMGESIVNDFWDGWNEAKTYDKERLIYIVDNAYIPDKYKKQTKLVDVKWKKT